MGSLTAFGTGASNALQKIMEDRVKQRQQAFENRLKDEEARQKREQHSADLKLKQDQFESQQLIRDITLLDKIAANRGPDAVLPDNFDPRLLKVGTDLGYIRTVPGTSTAVIQQMDRDRATGLGGLEIPPTGTTGTTKVTSGLPSGGATPSKPRSAAETATLESIAALGAQIRSAQPSTPQPSTPPSAQTAPTTPTVTPTAAPKSDEIIPVPQDPTILARLPGDENFDSPTDTQLQREFRLKSDATKLYDPQFQAQFQSPQPTTPLTPIPTILETLPPALIDTAPATLPKSAQPLAQPAPSQPPSAQQPAQPYSDENLPQQHGVVGIQPKQGTLATTPATTPAIKLPENRLIGTYEARQKAELTKTELEAGKSLAAYLRTPGADPTQAAALLLDMGGPELLKKFEPIFKVLAPDVSFEKSLQAQDASGKVIPGPVSVSKDGKQYFISGKPVSQADLVSGAVKIVESENPLVAEMRRSNNIILGERVKSVQALNTFTPTGDKPDQNDPLNNVPIEGIGVSANGLHQEAMLWITTGKMSPPRSTELKAAHDFAVVNKASAIAALAGVDVYEVQRQFMQLVRTGNLLHTRTAFNMNALAGAKENYAAMLQAEAAVFKLNIPMADWYVQAAAEKTGIGQTPLAVLRDHVDQFATEYGKIISGSAQSVAGLPASRNDVLFGYDDRNGHHPGLIELIQTRSTFKESAAAMLVGIENITKPQIAALARISEAAASIVNVGAGLNPDYGLLDLNKFGNDTPSDKVPAGVTFEPVK